MTTSQSVIDASKRLDIKNKLLDLLCEAKNPGITVQCGLRVLDLLIGMPEFGQNLHEGMYLYIASCYVYLERDFDCDPWEVVYNGKVIFNNK